MMMAHCLVNMYSRNVCFTTYSLSFICFFNDSDV